MSSHARHDAAMNSWLDLEYFNSVFIYLFYLQPRMFTEKQNKLVEVVISFLLEVYGMNVKA